MARRKDPFSETAYFEIVKHKAASANLDGAPETEHLSAWVVAWLAIMYVFSRLFAWI